MPIKQLENIRRLPRQGKIRLGYMKPGKAGKKEYPFECGFFILDPEVDEGQEIVKEFARLYGEQPTSIDIMFPVESPEVVFPQWYKKYKKFGGSGLLTCKGDGEVALRLTKEKGMTEYPCKGDNCEEYLLHQCKRVGTLQVMLPELPGIGVWQINTTSWNSIVSLNSAMPFVKDLCGRIAMIPLKLQLTKQPTTRIVNGEASVSFHYIMGLDTKNLRVADLQLAGQIPATQVALPAPDESRDELLFTGDGGQPVEEAKTLKAPQPKKPKQEFTYKVAPGITPNLFNVQKIDENGEIIMTYHLNTDTNFCNCSAQTPNCKHFTKVEAFLENRNGDKGASKAQSGVSLPEQPEKPALKPVKGKNEPVRKDKPASKEKINTLCGVISKKVISFTKEEIEDCLPKDLTNSAASLLLAYLLGKEEVDPSDFLEKVAELYEGEK